MTTEIKTTMENAIEQGNFRDMVSALKEYGFTVGKNFTKAQAIEAITQALAEDRFTDKDHGKGHGVSYYLDGKRVFNIKTRRKGQAIVFFTKASGVSGLGESKDTRYATALEGAYDEVLAKAKELVIEQTNKDKEEGESTTVEPAPATDEA